MAIRLRGVATTDFPPFTPQLYRFGQSTSANLEAEVHIFVGENGTGKTRLLSLLMAACGNSRELDDRKTGKITAAVVAATNGNEAVWNTDGAVAINATPKGDLLEMYGKTGTRGLGHTGQPNFSAYLQDGAALAFRSVASIRDEKIKPMENVSFGPLADLLVFKRDDKTNGLLRQALSNMKIRAGMYVASNPGGSADRVVRMTTQLERTLERITGRPFTFIVEYDANELRLLVNWGGNRMRLHQLPDGLRAIISWLAECIAKLDLHLPSQENPLEQPVVVFLDEPESHLHPAWQRQILPSLQTLLPRAQIFVATHSPFVISSVNNGWIYVLKSDAEGRVKINEPQPCSKGDSYIDAVEDVLGLKEWYDPETERLLGEFRELRDIALASGDTGREKEVHAAAAQIAARSESLAVMMGNELKQLESRMSALGH